MMAIYPSGTGLGVVSAGADAIKACVPFNTPYLIVEPSDLPSDWSTSAAWECDFSAPSGHGLGSQRYAIEQSLIAIAVAEADTFIPTEPVPQSEDDTDENYALYLQLVAKGNDSAAQEHAARKAQEIGHRLSIIAMMKAEVLQLEGVQL